MNAPRPYRRTYVVNQDTGLYRHPLALGAITFGGVFGALSTAGPLALAIGMSAAIAFTAYTWRIVEADRRAIEVETKADLTPVRAMVETARTGSSRTLTVAGQSLPVELIKNIGIVAARNGGKVTRAVLREAGAPRDVYHDTGKFQEGWQALGYVVPRHKTMYLTQRGRKFTADPAPPHASVRALERT